MRRFGRCSIWTILDLDDAQHCGMCSPYILTEPLPEHLPNARVPLKQRYLGSPRKPTSPIPSQHRSNCRTVGDLDISFCLTFAIWISLTSANVHLNCEFSSRHLDLWCLRFACVHIDSLKVRHGRRRRQRRLGGFVFIERPSLRRSTILSTILYYFPTGIPIIRGKEENNS